MANFDTGNLVTAQLMLEEKFGRPEMRTKMFPALQLLLGNGEFMTGDLNAIRTREDRPIEIHMLKRTRRNSGTSRAHDHGGTIDDSMKVTPTWAIKSDKTAISLKLLDRSVFDFNTVLTNKVYQCMINILEDWETAAIAWLQANKSQYSATLKGLVSFNAANDTIEVSSAAESKNRFFQLLQSAMKQNNHKGRYDIITDNILAVDAEFLKAQGGGNSTNYGFQFGPFNMAESNDLADANYPDGVVIAIPENSACALNWIPKQNREGFGDYNSYVGGFGSMSDPFGFGIDFAVHGFQERANTSASNGDTQDVQMEFELSTDLSFNAAPISGAVSESVIFQAGLKP